MAGPRSKSRSRSRGRSNSNRRSRSRSPGRRGRGRGGRARGGRGRGGRGGRGGNQLVSAVWSLVNQLRGLDLAATQPARAVRDTSPDRRPSGSGRRGRDRTPRRLALAEREAGVSNTRSPSGIAGLSSNAALPKLETESSDVKDTGLLRLAIKGSATHPNVDIIKFVVLEESWLPKITGSMRWILVKEAEKDKYTTDAKIRADPNHGSMYFPLPTNFFSIALGDIGRSVDGTTPASFVLCVSFKFSDRGGVDAADCLFSVRAERLLY